MPLTYEETTSCLDGAGVGANSQELKKKHCPRLLPTPCYHFTALSEFLQLVCNSQKWIHSQSLPLVKVQEKRQHEPSRCSLFILTAHNHTIEHCHYIFLHFEF